MTPLALAVALAIPAAARVLTRLPKTAIRRAFPRQAPAAVDTLRTVTWLAALKPATTGLAAGPTDSPMSELHIVYAELKNRASLTTAPAVIHRAIAYPVLLVTRHRDTLSASVVRKRASAKGEGSQVLEGPLHAGPWWNLDDDRLAEWLVRLSLGQPSASSSLPTVLAQWWHAIDAARTADRLGHFAHTGDASHSWTEHHDVLTTAIREHVAVLKTATQFRDKVAARSALRALEADLAHHLATLTPDPTP